MYKKCNVKQKLENTISKRLFFHVSMTIYDFIRPTTLLYKS